MCMMMSTMTSFSLCNFLVFSFAHCCIGSKNIIVQVSKGILSFFFRLYLPSCGSILYGNAGKNPSLRPERIKKNSVFYRFVPGLLPRISSQLLEAKQRTISLFLYHSKVAFSQNGKKYICGVLFKKILKNKKRRYYSFPQVQNQIT